MQLPTKEQIKTIAVVVLIIIVTILATLKLNSYINQKTEPKETIMTQEEVQNPEKLRQEVNKNSGANLDTYQSREVTNTVTKIIERDRKPNTTIETNGTEYLTKAKAYANEQKADAYVIAPAKGETKEVKDINKTDVVNLNQYNIEAYPARQMGMTYYSDGDIAIDYQQQVKILGKHMYVGPAVKIDNDKSTAIGITATIPF